MRGFPSSPRGLLYPLLICAGSHCTALEASESAGTDHGAVWSGPAVEAIHFATLSGASFWAKLSYAIAGALAIVALWRVHQRRLAREARYSRRLELEVAKRTQELAERAADLEEVNRRLKVASLSDPLTGLGNRRSLQQSMPILLTEATARSAQGETASLALLIVDLDHLKPINDRFGHESGDRLLSEVSAILRECTRASDHLVRWGGDEFVVICTPTNLEGAALLAERIRVTIDRREFRVSRSQIARTSCSIGFACYPFVSESPAYMSWEQVLKLADLALYQAKSSRNAWVGWEGASAELAVGELLRRLETDPEAAISSGYVGVRRSCGLDEADVDRLLRSRSGRA